MDNPIEARQVPEVRQNLVEDLFRIGPEQMLRFIRDHPTDARLLEASARETSELTEQELAAYLTVETIKRVRDAELFYVSDAMTEVAVAAGASLPAFRLMPEDLPAPQGFIVWGSPIAWAKRDPREAPVVAASWAPDGDAVGVSFYYDHTETALYTQVIEKGGAYLRGHRNMFGVGRLSMTSEAVFTFREEPDWTGLDFGEDTRPEDMGYLESLGRTMIATWLLASQEIATEERLDPDRGTRRRLERQGAVVQPIRLLTLRRARRPGRAEPLGAEPGRNYHHQWVVRGHWRNHWFPSRQDHKPIWIAPYIAGPEDAPLIGAERVNVLRR
ncbi:hypothetical protein GCM10022419_022070 [Nonomuraea rosea]|uniref:Uncharacterized protein n=1 Tax=Nonomuraea rosea TaxID=638574 RepID=A0ABP6VUP6_9ACTN